MLPESSDSNCLFLSSSDKRQYKAAFINRITHCLPLKSGGLFFSNLFISSIHFCVNWLLDVMLSPLLKTLLHIVLWLLFSSLHSVNESVMYLSRFSSPIHLFNICHTLSIDLYLPESFSHLMRKYLDLSPFIIL